MAWAKMIGMTPGIIHPQRHERSAARIHFASHGALGVLHRDFALRLGDGDDTRDHPGQQQHQGDAVAEVELRPRSRRRGKNMSLSALRPRAAAPGCRS